VKASLRLDVDPFITRPTSIPNRCRRISVWSSWCETYLDLSLPRSWELRLGRQHVVWGEVVGLFFADVVSARDLRDFILPDFEILRIPQWAARAEWFGADTHFELLWIPFPSYDDIGKQGAEFILYCCRPRRVHAGGARRQPSGKQPDNTNPACACRG
jgi:hypothetical protein